MYRVEDKYLVSERELLVLQSKLSAVLKQDSNQSGGRGYTISSVYFDDYRDSCYHDAVDGVRMRKKYRIRIYNHSFDTIKLEIKYKWNNRVMKKSRRITREQMKLLMSGTSLPDVYECDEDAMALFNLAMNKDLLRPKVIVEYERMAFVYEPGNVRITLDRNIRASRDMQQFSEEQKWTSDILQENDCILEVKYDEFLPGFIARILESGNMIQSSYSKYRLCREREENNL